MFYVQEPFVPKTIPSETEFRSVWFSVDPALEALTRLAYVPILSPVQIPQFPQFLEFPKFPS